MSIAHDPPALPRSSGAADIAAPLDLPLSPAPDERDLGVTGEPGQAASPEPRRDHNRSVRLRRVMARLRRDGDTDRAEGSPEDVAELRLELLLLREENARLKADRHRPPDLGTLIDSLRLISESRACPETVEDAWSMLADCVAVREALAQARVEAEAAIDALCQRLRESPLATGAGDPVNLSRIDPQCPDPAPATPSGSPPTAAKRRGLVSAA